MKQKGDALSPLPSLVSSDLTAVVCELMGLTRLGIVIPFPVVDP